MQSAAEVRGIPAHGAATASLWLRAAFWASILIAVAVVIRRVVALALPAKGGSSPTAALDAVFASHAALTLAHILPALAFVVVAPLFYLRATRDSAWPARLLYPLGAIVGVTAFAMSAYAVGGWVERSAVLLFNSIFLAALGRSYAAQRLGDSTAQRRWMTRAIAVLLGIATTRPVMGVFFATRAITHLSPAQFFGLAFWIGFSINTLGIEIWLRRHSQPAHAQRV